jgi:hypothetical protein
VLSLVVRALPDEPALPAAGAGITSCQQLAAARVTASPDTANGGRLIQEPGRGPGWRSRRRFDPGRSDGARTAAEHGDGRHGGELTPHLPGPSGSSGETSRVATTTSDVSVR